MALDGIMDNRRKRDAGPPFDRAPIKRGWVESDVFMFSHRLSADASEDGQAKSRSGTA
jgi:hypothetical protein